MADCLRVSLRLGTLAAPFWILTALSVAHAEVSAVKSGHIPLERSAQIEKTAPGDGRTSWGTDLPALKSLPPTTDQSALGRRGYFYVGGHYVGEGADRVMQGQAYVEVLVPTNPTQPYPIAMIHGGAQTSTNFLQTPDGRPGWADYFVRQGYVVYLVEQPARGRSPFHPKLDGGSFNVSPDLVEQMFAAPERHNKFPQAARHNQWPGAGREGDPIFDAFFAGQVETVTSVSDTQRRTRDAVNALIDRVGPLILLTHSQSGPIGWTIADSRPQMVKAIVAVEPSGPPFEDEHPLPARAQKVRPYGLTDIAVAYDPPITSPDELVTERQKGADAPGLHSCLLQREPARSLANIKRVPVLFISGEGSYHAPYDHCTVKYLRQAGVSVKYIRLADNGITGNGHMMMLEKNNMEIADIIRNWLNSEKRE